MKNNVTELVFIIDRSGSMAGFESDTVGGFNAMIEKQKKIIKRDKHAEYKTHTAVKKAGPEDVMIAEPTKSTTWQMCMDALQPAL